MTDVNDSNVEVTTEVQTAETTVTNELPFKTVEEAIAELARVNAEREKDSELLKKVRKYEKENKERAEAAQKEQGKWKELYEEELAKRESFETKAREASINSVLKEALKESGAKAVDTVMKLVDKAGVVVDEDGNVDIKSVNEIIKSVQQSDPFLFGEVETTTAPTTIPAAKRATEGERLGGYEAEIAAAKTQKELTAVLKKYGMA